MKKLLLKSLLFFFILIVTVTLILFLPPVNSIKNTDIFALPEKDKLLKSTIGPRIIIIGGSNTSCGLNSQMIKDSLKFNPINTGIHAGIGLKFMLSHNLNFIRPNDIIIVSPEYQQFYNQSANGDLILVSILVDVLKQTKDCKLDQLFKLLKYVPEYCAAKLQLWEYFEKKDTTDNYKRSFNQYGDAWPVSHQKNIPLYGVSGNFNSEALQALKSFNEAILKRNARLFITFPGYQNMSYNSSIPQIKEVQQRLQKNGFILLGTPERYKMDDSLISNTPYHLIKRGVDYRTSLLIEDLKKQLSIKKTR
jgi:hypothetical protein